MESYLMKRLILVCLVIVGITTAAVAQKSEWQVDKFGVTYGSTISVVPIELSGIMDKGTGWATHIHNSYVTENPEYGIQDTLSILAGISVNVGLNIPLYRSTNWSVGTKLNAGIGYHENVTAAEGVKGLIYEFPQFIYYRNYKSKVDYTLLVGYKYTKAPLSYHLPLAAVEVGIRENLAVRLHGSLTSYNYYIQFTDGRTKPAIKYHDFGISFVVYP